MNHLKLVFGLVISFPAYAGQLPKAPDLIADWKFNAEERLFQNATTGEKSVASFLRVPEPSSYVNCELRMAQVELYESNKEAQRANYCDAITYAPRVCRTAIKDLRSKGLKAKGLATEVEVFLAAHIKDSDSKKCSEKVQARNQWEDDGFVQAPPPSEQYRDEGFVEAPVRIVDPEFDPYSANDSAVIRPKAR